MTSTLDLPDESTIERRLIAITEEARALRTVLRAVRKMRLAGTYLDVVADDTDPVRRGAADREVVHAG